MRLGRPADRADRPAVTVPGPRVRYAPTMRLTSSRPAAPALALLALALAASGCPRARVPGPSDPLPGANPFAAIWVAPGVDKVWRYERRAVGGADVRSPVWDGSTIRVKAALEESPGVNLVVETDRAVAGVSVAIGPLTGPGGFAIRNGPARTGNAVFSNQGAPLQVLRAHYIQLAGINRANFGYTSYFEERVVPQPLRLPPARTTDPGAALCDRSHAVRAAAGAAWADRPGADQWVPNVLIPMEVEGQVDVPATSSQLFALDLWLSPSVIGATPPAGTYRGAVEISVAGAAVARLPLELTLVGATLPYAPEHGLVVTPGWSDTVDRMYGAIGTAADQAALPAQRRLDQLLHAYRISPSEDAFDAAGGEAATGPTARQQAQLGGSLYSAAEGYAGPGQGVGDYAFFIGTYGSWRYVIGDPITASGVQAYLDGWATWLGAHAPSCDVAWYVTDEPPAGALAEPNAWIGYQHAPGYTGPGRTIPSLVTYPISSQADLPQLGRFMSSPGAAADTAAWSAGRSAVEARGGTLRLYNGSRPGLGSFMIEDSGVSNALPPLENRHLRTGHHFYWQVNYYQDFQNNTGAAQYKDLFNQAMTFGATPVTPDPVYGWTSPNGSNGDGVLVYPGRDRHYPGSDHGLDGFFPSFRLRALRLGLNAELWAGLAATADAARVTADLDAFLGAANGGAPQLGYEIGVFAPADPTYQYGGVTWSEDPARLEALRLGFLGTAGY